ncbi:MAG: hypothetical protein KC620_19360, partial [Myxococcales bacterium]|nr:hypothetical protein [Myxococcales bacterium]
KNKLYSPVAISGVTHLYHLIEQAMLGDHPSARLRISGVKLGKRTDLQTCVKRLGVKDKLPASKQESRRHACDEATASVLVDAFDARFGRFVVRLLSDFAPYEANNQAALELYESLSKSTADAAGPILAILFDGQSMDRVFADYREALRDELKQQKDLGEKVDPHLKAVKHDFDLRADELEVRRKDLSLRRTENMLSAVPAKLRKSPGVQAAMADLYANTFTTSAFQRALAMTFFWLVAELDEQRDLVSAPVVEAERLDQLFAEYLDAVNGFFKPTSEAGLKALFKVMMGELSIQDDDYAVPPSSTALRNLLIHGMLDPQEWPKFRFMLVELWQSADAPAEEALAQARKGYREAAFTALVSHRVKRRAHDLGVSEAKVMADTKAYEDIRESCALDLAVGLECLGSAVTAEGLLAMGEVVPADPDEEDEAELEGAEED